MSVDLSRPVRVHVVGIGGAGMSAIARLLAASCHPVSGSDLKDSPALERLRALGIEVFIGHEAAQIAGAELVATSSAVPSTNVEVVEALHRGIPVHTRAELLAAICATRRTIAVSGTHGKTTTTSMLALIMVEAGLAPSFIVGGEVNEIGTNAALGSGEFLVVEADESDGTFLKLHREVAVVTSVEPDHLEHYGSFEALRQAFDRFLVESPVTIVCVDDENARGLAPPGALTYGFSDHAIYRIVDFRAQRAAISFGVLGANEELGRFTLPVPGAHNARNALGAILAARVAGASTEAARRALARFAGVARRFQFRGEIGGVSFVDDYAHLPGEVAATLAAARAGGWRRIVCVFQPHRYSRVEALASSFADSFEDADLFVLTAIYGAGESPRPGVSSKLILDATLNAHPSTAAVYLPERAELLTYLRRVLRPGDCCLTLSAGDLTSLPDELVSALSRATS